MFNICEIVRQVKFQMKLYHLPNVHYSSALYTRKGIRGYLVYVYVTTQHRRLLRADLNFLAGDLTTIKR